MMMAYFSFYRGVRHFFMDKGKLWTKTKEFWMKSKYVEMETKLKK